MLPTTSSFGPITLQYFMSHTACSAIRAEASDAVQEIFFKVFRNIGGFKGEAALKTWIFKIAFSEILNRLRWWKSRYRSSTVSLDDEPNGNGTSGHNVADSGPTPEEMLQIEGTGDCDPAGARETFERSPIDYGACAISKDSPTRKSRMFWEFRSEPLSRVWHAGERI